MKRVHLLLVGVLMAWGMSVPAWASEWKLDSAHSGFYFTVDHIFSKVRGHFNEFAAEIMFDPANPGGASFSFTIETGSVDTNIAKRDKHLQSADFFDAGKFPQMQFTSSAVKALDGGKLEVEGILTVKGVEHKLVLPLEFAGVKDHPAAKGKQVIGFNSTIVLDRLELGVGEGKFHQMGVVGKDVEVLVTLEALSD